MQNIYFVSNDLTLDNSQSNKILKRIDNYSKALSDFSSSDLKVTVYIRTNHVSRALYKNQIYPYLKLVPLSDSVMYGLHFATHLCRGCIMKSRTPTLLIAGDPWKDTLIVTTIKKFLWWAPIRTQMSVHGDLVNQEKSRFKRFIKQLWLSIAFKNSDSIRVVSEHLKDEIVHDFQIPRSKMFVAPIPVYLPEQVQIQPNSKHFIGFVGRLHYERGLSEFIEIVSKLNQSSMEFKYLIVGDGPNRTSFLDNLSSVVGPENIDFRGFLDENEIVKAWKDCKILLSTAPSEGYGLALRESLLNGTFVVARKNAGTNATQAELEFGIHTYSNTDEAVNLIKSLMTQTFPVHAIEKIRLQVEESNKKSLKMLINSWQLNPQLTDETQESS